MAYKLTKGDQSHYDIAITFTAEDKAREKDHVLKHFQADMSLQGFRKGHVPMDLVEKNLQPGYLEMAIIEHIANHGIQEVLKENESIKFIGEPYGFSQQEKDGVTTLTLKLDVFPEVEVTNEKWKEKKIKKLNVKVEAPEIEQSLVNLKKNFADYQDAETIALDTVSKIALEWLDKKGEVLDKGTTYLGEPEFSESDFWEKTFLGKKKNDSFELKYDAKKLPAVMHEKTDLGSASIKCTISDIKKQILPEFTPENIKKFFGNQSDFSDEAGLKSFIEKTLKEQKEQTELVKAVEDYVSTIRKESFSVVIPMTMIDQEFKSRMDSLMKRFGGQEKTSEYLQQMPEDKRKKFVEDIQSAAKESLEKYFILNKAAELLGLQLDWENSTGELAVEKKLYAFFNDKG
ncbi:hypothetical protein J5893_01255 [bacterium]|nr:hypothetical protein [bacterium]